MAGTIQHKRSTTASAVPLAGDLSPGELAINTTDEKLYIKNTGGTVVEVGGGGGGWGSGDLTMDAGAQIFLEDGTATDPAITFTSDPNVGISYSAGTMNLVYNGQTKMQVANANVTMANGAQFQADQGSVTVPGLSFGGSTTNGFSTDNVTGGTLNMLVGGTTYAYLKPSVFSVTPVAQFAGGVDKLTTASGVVSVAASTAPTVGQVLTATSSTVATWQDAGAGGGVMTEDTTYFNQMAGDGALASLTTDAALTQSVVIGTGALEDTPGSDYGVWIGYRAGAYLIGDTQGATMVGWGSGEGHLTSTAEI